MAKRKSSGSEIFFRFPVNPQIARAVDKLCGAEYLTLANFGRQAVVNELVRRGYLRPPRAPEAIEAIEEAVGEAKESDPSPEPQAVEIEIEIPAHPFAPPPTTGKGSEPF